MTARDRMIIVVVLLVAALGGVWFVGLAPKRKEAAEIQTKIDAANTQLVATQQKAAQARQARARYDVDYAAVATLGKAVPKNDALPSLLYQLQSAARGARIDFTSLKINGGGGPSAATPTPTGSAATPTTSGASAGSSTPSTSSSAPATQAAATTLPPGATVGSAGFPTMPFSFVFSGSFFDMERFLNEVQKFVRVEGDAVDVRGRLLSVDAFGLTPGPGGFPNVKATITATAYLRSPSDDVLPTDSASASTGSSTASAASATTSTPTAAGANQ